MNLQDSTVQAAIIGALVSIIIAALGWKAQLEKKKLKLEIEKLQKELGQTDSPLSPTQEIESKSLSSNSDASDDKAFFREGEILPIICFDVILRNVPEEDAKAVANFTYILRSLLYESLGHSDTDWAASNIGSKWIVVSILNKPRSIVTLTEKVFLKIEEFNRVTAKGNLSKRIQIRAAMHYGCVYFFRGLANTGQWEVIGDGIDLITDLVKIGSEKHILCTESMGSFLTGQEEFSSLSHELRGKYHIGKKEITLYNVHNNGLGNSNQPTQGQIYPHWNTRLVDMLSRSNIKPSKEIITLLSEIGEEAIAIDDVVSLVETPGFRGWNSFENIEMKIVDTPVTQFPSNWDYYMEKYGALTERGKDLPKLYIDQWDPYIIDQGGKLYLYVAETSFSNNKTLEKIFQNNIQIKLFGEKTTLRDYYNKRDNVGQPHFWNYLPNILYVSLVIVTKDNQFVVIKRSPQVTYYPNHWTITMEEMINPKEDNVTDKDNLSNIFYNAIRRGVKEELGEMIQIESVKTLGIYREYPMCNVSISALVRISQDAVVLEESRKLAVDRYEGVLFDYKPFDIDSVIRTLSRENYVPSKVARMHEGKFHGSARYRLLMAALAEFDQDEFRAALQQLSH